MWGPVAIIAWSVFQIARLLVGLLFMASVFGIQLLSRHPKEMSVGILAAGVAVVGLMVFGQ